MTAQRLPYLLIEGLAAPSAVEISAKNSPGRCVCQRPASPSIRQTAAIQGGIVCETAPSPAYLKPSEFYRDGGIEVVLGDAACGYRTEYRTGVARLSSGRHTGVTTLLLATALARAPLDTPGGLLPGARTPRNLEDAIALRDEIAAGRRVIDRWWLHRRRPLLPRLRMSTSSKCTQC